MIIKFLNILLWVCVVIVIMIYAKNAVAAFKNTRPLFMLRNLNLSYDSKMEMQIGKLPYDYMMFVKDNTPKSATILIPPQSYPWDQTSNVGYLRYFLYPRNLLNGDEKNPKVDLKTVDYVLIDYGETDISQYGYTNIWPKFDLEGEYIIYWNPEDGSTKKVEDVKYVYKSGNRQEKWGLIKIKK